MLLEALFPIGILNHIVDTEISDKVENLFLEKINHLPKNDDQYSDFFLPDKIINLHEDVPELFEEILFCRDNYVDATGLSCNRDHVQYWTQDYRDEGNYHKSHSHGIYGVSGVYWIRANENAGDFRFTNPNQQTHYTSFDKNTMFSWIDYRISPEKGKMILFPSYIYHEVLPSQKNAIRSTIAFNFPLEQKFT